MPVPEIKAAGFNSLIGTLRAMVPASDFAAFIAALPPDSASLLLEPPLAVSWISLERAAPVYPAAFERLFGRDSVKMFEVGRTQIRADFTGIYRAFMRIASPEFVADRSSDIYKLYTRECGTLRTVLKQPGRIEVLLEGRPHGSLAFYHYLRGTVFGAIELTGVMRLNVAIIDGGGDSSRCQIRATWS